MPSPEDMNGAAEVIQLTDGQQAILDDLKRVTDEKCTGPYSDARECPVHNPGKQRADVLLNHIERAPIVPAHPLLKYFRYEHLPEHLREVSKPFGLLAQLLATSPALVDPAERTVALRKLLESKDAAVRAALK